MDVQVSALGAICALVICYYPDFKKGISCLRNDCWCFNRGFVGRIIGAIMIGRHLNKA